jgi:DNA-binding transcriptional regulator YiaG
VPDNEKERMKNTDHFIHEFVRIRYKISVSEASKRLNVSRTTWMSWESGATGMSSTLWPRFNETFQTNLALDNVGGPGASYQDLQDYLALKEAGETPKAPTKPKPKVKPLIVLTQAACRAVRKELALTTPYDCADVVGVPMATWQKWWDGRSPAPVSMRRRMRELIADQENWAARQDAYYKSGVCTLVTTERILK